MSNQNRNCHCGQMMHWSDERNEWYCDYCGYSEREEITSSAVPVNTYRNFNIAYRNLLDWVSNCGNEVTIRGNKCKEVIPVYFEITNPRDRLLNIDFRNEKIRKYIFGELLWYLSGSNKLDFISKYSSMWEKLSDYGTTCNSAYGYYIFDPYIRYGNELITQWDFCKEKLQNDKCTRQAIIHIKPIQLEETKDVVCTLYLQFFIRDNKLDLIVNMRSNDLMFGTTYDVFMFTFLQELMAAELGIEVGTYKHFAGNMHIYDKDKEKIERILSMPIEEETFEFAKISANFREHDLPILLELEERYWKKGKKLKGRKRKINKLSTIAKQLLSFLTGETYE